MADVFPSTRVVDYLPPGTITEWDEAGVLRAGYPRGFTPEEAAEAAGKMAAARAGANRHQLIIDARAQLVALLSSIDALQAIAQKDNADIGPADIKDVARETRQGLRQVVRLTRIIAEALDQV